MPRRRIELHPGEYYHIYNRGVDRQRTFFDSESYAFFLRKLRQYVSHPPDRPVAADIVAYCLMPNHYHLVIQLKSSEFSDSTRSFGQSYVQAINRRYERTGPLFERRFQAIRVDRTEYLLHLSRYVHLNPVTAHLVGRPEDWQFSSYRDYLGLRDGSLPQAEAIWRECEARNDYARFVESGIGRDDPMIQHLIVD